MIKFQIITPQFNIAKYLTLTGIINKNNNSKSGAIFAKAKNKDKFIYAEVAGVSVKNEIIIVLKTPMR